MKRAASLPCRITAFLLSCLLFLHACKPFENTVSLAPVNPPVVRTDLTYSYSAEQIRYSNNHIKKGWANRNHVQVLQIELINNSEKPIHGSQLRFFNQGKQLELVDPVLASKKLKTKKFPTAVYVIPLFIVGLTLYYATIGQLYEDLPEEDWDTGPTVKKNKDPLAKANRLQRELYNFNIASQIIRPGEKISGFIALRSEQPIHQLDIQIEKNDLEVIAPTALPAK